MPSTPLKTINYGTHLLPTSSKGILGRFESLPKTQPHSQWNAFKAHSVLHPRRAASLETLGRLPSVSLILGCTQDQFALLRWQKQMVNRLGYDGFRGWMKDRAAVGTTFHKETGVLLKELNLHGSIEKTNEEIIEKVAEPAKGYMRSVLPVLRRLKANPTNLCLEEKVTHWRLKYQGRFDALLSYKDHVVLVDWKTSSMGSTKSRGVVRSGDDGHSDVLAHLYNDPIQLAAYIAAFNVDPRFQFFSQVQSGMLVIASEDGREAEIVEMRSSDIEEYWQKWLFYLNKFWLKVNEEDEKGAHQVDFVYREEEKSVNFIVPPEKKLQQAAVL